MITQYICVSAKLENSFVYLRNYPYYGQILIGTKYIYIILVEVALILNITNST